MLRREVLRLTVAAALPALPRGETWMVFDDHQAATTAVLADRIVPGAQAADVHRYLDMFLAAGPAAERAAFLDGLGRLDGYAREHYAAPFAACSPTQQNAILQAISAEKAPGRPFFDQAKHLTTMIYWSTEPGYRELNAGGRVPATFACESGISGQ
jgi:hypothetical protein